MGRGRAKAKQTKVARDLKYQSFQTDFGALAQELHGADHKSKDSAEDGAVDDQDEWADHPDSRRRD
jgi:hypothetical protein